MPTYTYLCSACKHEFEKEQRITEDPIKKCPKCGKMKAHRTITNGNFILKGGGWYSDGYSSSSSSSYSSKTSSPSNGSALSGSTSSSSSGTGSESSKTESKTTNSASASST